MDGAWQSECNDSNNKKQTNKQTTDRKTKKKQIHKQNTHKHPLIGQGSLGLTCVGSAVPRKQGVPLVTLGVGGIHTPTVADTKVRAAPV